MGNYYHLGTCAAVQHDAGASQSCPANTPFESIEDAKMERLLTLSANIGADELHSAERELAIRIDFTAMKEYLTGWRRKFPISLILRRCRTDSRRDDKWPAYVRHGLHLYHTMTAGTIRSIFPGDGVLFDDLDEILKIHYSL